MTKHHCTGPSCSHADHSHHSAEPEQTFRPVNIPAPIPMQPLPETLALAIQAVRSRLSATDGHFLGPDAPKMFLRPIASLGETPRTMHLHELNVMLARDTPSNRAKLTNELRRATALEQLKPVKRGHEWSYAIGIEAKIDPAVILAIWFAASAVEQVVSSRLSGYSSDGMWTVENGLEPGTFRIVQAGPIG